MSDRLGKKTVGDIAAARPEELRELHRLLTAVFGSDSEAVAWLHTEVPALHARTPISLIRRGKPERVTKVLAAMESRAFR